MQSLQSKELKARKKLGKALIDWLKSNTKIAEEQLRKKLTAKEWKELNKLVNELGEEVIKETEKTGNIPLAMRNFFQKLERNPFYEELLNKLEYKMAKEGLSKAKHRKPDYIA